MHDRLRPPPGVRARPRLPSSVLSQAPRDFPEWGTFAQADELAGQRRAETSVRPPDRASLLRDSVPPAGLGVAGAVISG